IGVTADIARRVWEHRHGTVDGFTKRYQLRHLVWCERHEDIVEAIAREKKLKKWPRAWKIGLVEEANPHWLPLDL
ncbi:MAG: GIY-YIG nuclease family protein, partial [Tagaea sp.]|nr:GIY-YIG nuclease family protein [Tagaea sp.]